MLRLWRAVRERGAVWRDAAARSVAMMRVYALIMRMRRRTIRDVSVCLRILRRLIRRMIGDITDLISTLIYWHDAVLRYASPTLLLRFDAAAAALMPSRDTPPLRRR